MVGRATWIDVPCKTLRKDALSFHEKSSSHADAVAMETQLGCGRTVIEKVVGIERKAMMGKFQCLYWLCKEEVAHTTKFEFLLMLASDLGV